jgi:hypothetical protein
MSDTTRREFIKQTGAGLAGAALLGNTTTAGAPAPAAIPPHRPVPVHGVHAYPGEHSVAAGDTLTVHVSSSVPYRLSICRLGLNVDDPAGDEVLTQLPEQEARPLPPHPGCYVHVEKRLPGRRSKPGSPLPSIRSRCSSIIESPDVPLHVGHHRAEGWVVADAGPPCTSGSYRSVGMSSIASVNRSASATSGLTAA